MKNYGAGMTTIAVLFLVVTTLIAYSPDAAFWALFALLAMAAPIIVVVGAARWTLKVKRGAHHGKG